MNSKCLICFDLYAPHADVRAIQCGHLFHYHCLEQWLERSPTCPHCRSETTEQSIRKIYLNVEENAETLDPKELQNKVDNLQFQINLKEEDNKIANEKYENANYKILVFREEIKTQKHKIGVLELEIHALKEQIADFKSKSEDCNSLTILVSTLKKALVDSDKRVKQTQTRLKEAQNESQNYKMELSQLNRNYNRLQQEIEAHKHCESERQYPKKKIDDLASKSKTESGNPLNTSIRRIIEESPTPLPKLTQLKNESSNRDISPSIPEKVQTIEDSDSPYLQPQTSVVGYSPYLGKHAWLFNQRWSSASTVTNNKFSIFKPLSVQSINFKRHSTQGSDDGLGGHAKEELFQSPPQLQKLNLKRSKSSPYVTSAKFRKLSPYKKLTEFFNITK